MSEVSASWLRQKLADHGQDLAPTDRRDRIEALIEEHLLAAVEADGLRPLEALMSEKTDPDAAAAIAYASDRAGIPVLEAFTSEEVVAGCLRYLDGDKASEWAWSAICWGTFEDEDHWQILIELSHLAPDEDEVLWRIGDLPLGQLQMRPGQAERFKVAARTDPRLARILDLVERCP